MSSKMIPRWAHCIERLNTSAQTTVEKLHFYFQARGQPCRRLDANAPGAKCTGISRHTSMHGKTRPTSRSFSTWMSSSYPSNPLSTHNQDLQCEQAIMISLHRKLCHKQAPNKNYSVSKQIYVDWLHICYLDITIAVKVHLWQWIFSVPRSIIM